MKKEFTLKNCLCRFKPAKLYSTGLLILLLFASFGTAAQSDAERAKIKQSVNKSSMNALQIQLNKQHQQDEKKVADYLAKHSAVKRSFVKDESFYWMRTIDGAGNPVYINTKNVASGQLIKADQLYSGGSLGVNITGTGMIAGIWDGGQVRATHELLAGSVAMEPGQTLDGSGSNNRGNNHQTHVSGTMVGKNIAAQPSAKGIAYTATLKNYDFSNDLAEMTTFAAGGYLISNHSYGGANDNTTPLWKFGAYDSEARDWDILAKNSPNYLTFVAGGNEQQSNGNPTKNGYDIITGSSAAKNNITVGAVNGDMTMSDYSNWGPTDDGRVKPDIVARGTGINSSYFADPVTNLPSDNSYSGNGANSSGTSYASPAAAASGLLLQQYYNSLYSTYLKSSTLKGLMLNTATDLGQPGPDPKFGWGLLNIEKAARLIKYKTAAANPAASSNTNTSALSYSYIEEITFNPTANSSAEGSRDVVASGCEPLVVSMSWTDDEGPEQTSAEGVDPTTSRLMYDFDFMVRNTTTFVDVRPWKPVSMANRTADAGTCTTWFDVNYNNFKQVIIQNPTPGQTYRIYFRKKTGSPATARIISLVISGLRVLPPTGSASQAFCSASTIASLVVTGTGVKWYDAATAGNLLPSTTPLVTGTIYYASQTIEGCESTTRLAVTVTAGSTAAPTGNATQSFCAASTVANLVVTGTAIKWYDAATVGNLLPSTTPLTNGTIYYASQTVGSCESATRFAVTVTIGATAAPTGNAAQSFCSAATVANLVVTGTAIKWYDAATVGNLLPSTTALTNGTIYYASQTVGSCESATRFAVTVTIGATAAPTGNAAQSFCVASTVANLVVTGTAIKWYDAATAGNLLPSTTPLTNGTIYYASQTVGSCESATRFAVTVTIGATAAPTGNAAQSFCSAATVANLVVTGTAIKWYDAATVGNLLPSTTALTNGTIYYASQTVGSCESATRFAVTVTLTTTTAPTGNASQSFCNAATVANLVATGTAIKWYDAATVGNLLPSTTVLTNGTIYYASQTVGGCESATRLAVTVTLTTIAAPTGNASQSFCNAATVANLVATGTAIKWYDAATAGNLLPSTTAITNGTIYYASQTIGGCESPTRFAVTVTIGATPAPTGIAAQSFCGSATVANLAATGTAIKWYDAAAAGNLLASTTALTNGTTYFASQTVGGCESVTRLAVTVTLTTAPNAIINYTGSPYCSNAGTAAVTQSGTSGGTYSATPAGLTINATTGAVTLATSAAGTYTVTYTIAASGGCNTTITTATITVTTAPVATIAYAASPYCANAGTANVTRTGTAGGVYSSTAGLTLNATTGAVTLGTSTPGTYTVTYTVAAAAGCGLFTTTTSISIAVLPTATIIYAGSPYCQNAGVATVTRTGASGGTYSSAAGLTINATTGDVTLASSTAGTYTVTYTIAAGGGCAAVTATTPITITTLPAATISYAGSPYCATTGTATVSRTGTAGGTYSSTAGLIINATTGDVNLATSTAGTYTVSYTLAAAGGCNAVTATTTILVNTLSVAPTGATVSSTNICGTSNVTLSVTGGSLGSGANWKWYSAVCGGTLVGTGAAITVTVNATTSYFVRAEGICNTTTCASVTATVNAQPTISIAASPYTSLMPTQSTTLTATVAPVLAGNTFVWYKNGNIASGANSNTLAGITVDQLGTYTARVTTLNGCTALSAPLVIKDSATDKLFVYPNPTNGKFKIRYYSSAQNFGFLRTVTIYNSFGERVYLNKIPVTASYSSMDIDISSAGKGFYILVVSDFYGKRLVTAKIEVL